MSLQKLEKLQKLMSNKRLSSSERQSIIGKINKMESQLELQCHGNTEMTTKESNKIANITKQKEEKHKRMQTEKILKKEQEEKEAQKLKDREYAELHRAKSQKIFIELLAKNNNGGVFRVSLGDEIADDWDCTE